MTEEQRRRLSAVMYTDVVGYTALMQGDEEAARLVRLRHRQALEAAIPTHGGELVQYLGDGSLSTFPSAVRAVPAAVEVQQALHEAVPLRISIHQGEIAFDDQGIYGDSVNVASRVMGVGTPGPSGEHEPVRAAEPIVELLSLGGARGTPTLNFQVTAHRPETGALVHLEEEQTPWTVAYSAP